MKKFLVFCVAIIVTVSLGFMVYYFTLNNEGVIVAQTSYQLNVGDTVSLEVNRINPKSSTKLSYDFEDDGIIEFNEKNSTLKAIGEGATRLVISASNSGIAPLYVDFYVGGGSKAFPFYIKTQADLARIGTADDVFRLDSNYKLANSIAIISETNWKAIGGNGTNAPTESFTGSFDGQGNTISNLKLNSDLYAGLFARIGGSGSVYNLIISNVTVGGNCAYGGAIAGVNNGTIKDCYVISGSLTSNYIGANIGGVVGLNESLTSTAIIYKCMSNVEITSSNVDMIGGIAGVNKGAEVNYSYTDLDTTINAGQETIAGGIVGKNTYSATYASVVAGCYVLGTFNGINNGVHGAIAGINDFNDATTVTEKTNKIYGNYYVLDSFARGVGNYDDVENATVTPNGERGIYGVESKTYTELCTQDTFKLLNDARTDTVMRWDFNNVWSMPNAGTPKFNKNGSFVANYRGLLAVPGEINTYTQLLSLTSNSSMEIAQDIDMGGIEWDPLDLDNITLTGKWIEEEGRYPSIYNFKIKNGDYVGFFGVLKNSLVENLNFEQVSNVNNIFSTSNDLYIGTIAGYIDVTTVLKNVTTMHQVSTNYSNNLNANISSNLDGKNIYVGGLVGASAGSINSCKSDGVSVNITYANNVSATTYVGGVTGALVNGNAVEKSTVSSFMASVGSGKDGSLGGVVGKLNESTSISRCYIENSELTASVNYTTGNTGLVGHYEGGVAGSMDNASTISGSSVYNVTIQGFMAGGIVGRTSGTINNCYTRANVTAYKAGGVAGYQSKGSISDCRVDGHLANPVQDLDYDLGDSSVFNHGSQKAGVVCISYGTQDDIPKFKNVFVNCTFAEDGHTGYITTATSKDNKNYSSVKVVYSGEESDIVYNEDTCSNARERGIVSGLEIVDAVFNMIMGETKVYSYGTNNEKMVNGNYDVFTENGFKVDNWSFVGKPTVQQCVNEYVQNA